MIQYSKKNQLILGGVKSGKSTFSISGLDSLNKKAFIATAQAFDQEMEKKIERHQKERNHTFLTIEEPVYLSKALKKAVDLNPSVIIVDCLTLWVSNLLFFLKDEKKIETEIQLFLDALQNLQVPCRIVSNEVGFGVIGIDEETRSYVNLLGVTNQRIAAVVEETILMVAGKPLYV